MSWTINYSESSREDLKSIFNYIALELLSPEYASGQAERIIKAIRKLEDLPMKHPVYDMEPWKSKQVRFVPVDNYIVFCLPKEEDGMINIIRIIYFGRDMKRQIEETTEQF